MTIDYQQIQPGWEVYSSDGDHIGSVDEVADSYITITKGLFLPKDYYIPQDAILRVDGSQNQVFIDGSKDDLDRLGYDQPPTASSTRSGRRASDATGETQRIPRYEEELRAEKSSRQAGEVQIDKGVTEERQGFDVPVTREDVEVRRVAVNRPASESDAAFSDGETLRVPVRAEQVEVTKEPRIVEEIEVRKTPRQETQRVEDTVRREQVNVRESGDVNVRGDRELAGAGAGADRMQRTDLDTQHDYESKAADPAFERTAADDVDEDAGDTGSNTPRW